MDSPRKRILILSDNDGLSRAIELNLRDCSDAEIVRVTGRSLGRQERQTIGDPSLIIVATSSPASEPVVALASLMTSLTSYCCWLRCVDELGLSIVQHIIEKLGGQVGVKSEVGQGAALAFALPAA